MQASPVAKLLAAASLIAAAPLAAPLLAAEGMWMPSQAPALGAALAQAGLAIPAASLADLAAPPMGAIASLGGCSASFVSPRGLVATNHHCVLGSIQFNATPQRNLLRDGFLARRLDEEVPAAPGTRVLVLQSLDDVTSQMLAGVTARTTGRARIRQIEANRAALIAACEAEPGIRCDVRAAFGGTQYWQQRMLEIRDVRLVHAPAGSIGNFGGEIDNWQWPRHTGDYSFYRAYVGPDGKPADFAPENVPYAPRAHLRLATDDLKEGDVVLIAGFPGRTERFRSAAETRGWYETIYPLQQRLLADYSALIARETKDEADRIAYASIKAGADNIAKKIKGQMEVASSADLVGQKDAADARLGEWAARPGNRRTHGTAIAAFDSLTPESLAAERAQLVNATLNRAQLLSAARTLYRWANEQLKPDAEREPGFQARDRQQLVDRLSLIDRRYVARIDRAILEQALAEVRQLPEAQRNVALEKAIADIGLDRLYAETKLADRDSRLAWLDQPPAAFMESEDPFIRAAVAGYAADMAAELRQKDLAGRVDAARHARMTAVRAHATEEGRLLYPDANGFLRFTFGHVRGRPTRDGEAWTAFTTAAGIL
ncbi:MAG: S46 family peptidase, partial [Sphingomonadaceae bacterium]